MYICHMSIECPIWWLRNQDPTLLTGETMVPQPTRCTKMSSSLNSSKRLYRGLYGEVLYRLLKGMGGV